VTNVVNDSDSNAREYAAHKKVVSSMMNDQLQATLDILRGELERLFTLEEMTSLCERLLGLDPTEVGGRRRGGASPRRSPSAASMGTDSTRCSM